MNDLKITANELLETASKLDKKAAELREYLNKIDQYCDDLALSWKSDAGTRYIQKVRDSKREVNRLFDVLAELPNHFRDAAQNASNVESSMNR